MKKKIAAAVTLIICTAFGGFLVAAKYMQSTPKQDTVVAKEFYFTSDLLDGEVHEITALNTDSNGDRFASVTIQLMNHEDELRYSDMDIPYTVTLQEEGEVSENSSKSIDGTLAGGKITNQLVVFQNLGPGKSYIITAKTNKTYEKELTATIKVNPVDDQIYCDLDDEGAYINITVWTDDYAGEIKLAYPNGLIPDNTDSWMSSWQRASSNNTNIVTLNSMGANASHVFRFFKENTSSEYSVMSSEGMVTIR